MTLPVILAAAPDYYKIWWVPLYLVALWYGFGLLNGRLSGWGRIARAFPPTPQPEGRMIPGVPVKVGWLGARVTVYVSEKGLYLAPTRFSGPSFRPIFIPWRELRNLREGREYGLEFVQFEVGSPVLGWFRMPRYVFEGFDDLVAPGEEPSKTEVGKPPPPAFGMTKAERLKELKMLQQQGVPQDMAGFSEWSHQVRAAIFNDGESRRWDFLSAEYKKGDLANASTKATMEQLIAMEIQDLEDYTKRPGQQPISGETWIAIILFGMFLLRAYTAFHHPSPESPATPSPTPRIEAISNQTPPPADSETPRPQATPRWW